LRAFNIEKNVYALRCRQIIPAERGNNGRSIASAILRTQLFIAINMICLLRNRQYANVVGSKNGALKMGLISHWILVAGAFEITTPKLRNGPKLPFGNSHHALRDESIYVCAQAFWVGENSTRSFRRGPRL
jgi:hypothetical protein